MATPLGISLIDLPALQDIVSTPTYTDLFNETLGDAGTDTDGFPVAFADLVDRVAAFEAEQGATETAVNIAGAIDSFAGADPAGLDATIIKYTGTLPTGAGFVADGQALITPDLLTLPIAPDFGGTFRQPPAQTSIDLGAHHVGDAPWSYQLGSYSTSSGIGGGRSGIFWAILSHGDPSIFTLTQTVTKSRDTEKGSSEVGFWTLDIVPSVAGAWIGQVSGSGGIFGTGSIITFNLTLLP